MADGFVVNRFGPKGLEYAKFSIDSHFARNYLYLGATIPTNWLNKCQNLPKKSWLAINYPKHNENCD
jgi:hypothetical protein